jgi:hypothetical protein
MQSGISSSQRVTAHNENKCTSASQVAQQYGDVCIIAVSSQPSSMSMTPKMKYFVALFRDTPLYARFTLLAKSLAPSTCSSP